MTTQKERDWPEGRDYTGTCRTCDNGFVGPKWRIMGGTCRACSKPDVAMSEPISDHPTVATWPWLDGANLIEFRADFVHLKLLNAELSTKLAYATEDSLGAWSEMEDLQAKLSDAGFPSCIDLGHSQPITLDEQITSVIADRDRLKSLTGDLAGAMRHALITNATYERADDAMGRVNESHGCDEPHWQATHEFYCAAKSERDAAVKRGQELLAKIPLASPDSQP